MNEIRTFMRCSPRCRIDQRFGLTTIRPALAPSSRAGIGSGDFAANPSMAGQPILVNGAPPTIGGVRPCAF
jgi:hypothetical protein